MKIPWAIIGRFVVKKVVPVIVSAGAAALAERAAKPSAPAKRED